MELDDSDKAIWGDMVADDPAPQEIEQEQGEELQPEDLLEETEAQEQEEIEEHEEAHETEEQEEKPKKRASRIPRERFDEVNEAKRQAEERARRLEWELEQQREANKILMQKALTGEESGEEGGDDEVLDTALEKKLSAELQQIKTQQAVTALQSDIARTAPPDFDEAFKLYVAGAAMQLVNEASSLGYHIDRKTALEEAEKRTYSKMLEVYQMNPRSGVVANYIYNQAKLLGYQPQTGQPAKSSVNMKAVERARQQAGAPAIHREPVQMGVTQSQQDAQVGKKLREEGYEDSYLRNFVL